MEPTKTRGSIKDGKAEAPTPGVVYLSRIPPFMQPRKVRHLFSQFGAVGRIYLQPEDPVVQQRRKKFGGNKRRNYTEGWVEFADKRVAKAVAVALNNTPVGGRKRHYYHDDLWNIKYLSKFRWTHLTEKKAYEQAVRGQKMRTEISQAKRENAHYLENVSKGKEIEAIVGRKRKKGEEQTERSQRTFKQRRLMEHTHKDGVSTTTRTTDPSKSKLSDTLLRKAPPQTGRSLASMQPHTDFTKLSARGASGH